MLLYVALESETLTCPGCGHTHDPQFRFCIKCGTKLPPPATTIDSTVTIPSGLSSGVEPDPDRLYEEPYYDHGRTSEPDGSDYTPLPAYAGSVVDDVDTETDSDKLKDPPPPVNRALAGFMVIFSLIVPPLGVILGIFWAFNRTYRIVVFPLLFAASIGAGLWGWALYADARQNVYNEPYQVLTEYIDAQDWARERTGHYHSLLDLKLKGFLPLEWPVDSGIELDIEEHVLGPTGYVVEIRPGLEESRYYGMQSLWSDHTGDVRLGTRDGPRFTQAD